MAPLGVTMIVIAPSAETMDPIRKTLMTPPLDMVIMTEVLLVLMGTLGRPHGGDSGAGRSKYSNEPLSYPSGSGGGILLPTVVRNKHFPTGAPAVLRG